MPPLVSSCHAGSDQIVVGILLLSCPVDRDQKGHQLTMVHLLEENSSGRNMMLVAKELPAIVLVTVMGRAIVQVVVLVLGTGSINMATVKEDKILELNCSQRQQTCFLITLLTSGITVSVSIPTAGEMGDNSD